MTRLEDIDVGDELPTFVEDINTIQLFRFSAITWNPHRIHYDRTHAQAEGHPDILVQAHFHGALVQRLLMDWAGPEGQIVELSWRNVDRATADTPLVVGGEVTAVSDATGTVQLDVWTKSDENLCAQGAATVRLREP
jgi:hydroxyacyl-ACP dehydratase HTD2-like protein with hotdog domain